MDRSRILASATIALTMVFAVVVFNNFRSEEPGNSVGTERVFSIRGHVEAGGTMPEGLWIRITGQQDGQVRSVSVPVKPDGTFEASDLAPGFYTLRAAQRGVDAAPSQNLGEATAMITDGDAAVVIALKSAR